MPHSSGGGSHGGGSHGGSHGGSSNHISHHYFPGARRFRRHYTDGRADEYIYASRMPAKTTKSSVVLICIIAAFFLFCGTFGIVGDMPRKLKTKYKDAPRVYDEYELIADDKSLEKVMNDFCDVTGICPVIITTYDELWNREWTDGNTTYAYADLEAYTYDMYVKSFSDEQHFVIVYSVPMDQAIMLYNGEKFVPDYQWEACQGDETDPIITDSFFRRFANNVQDKLEAGEDPGEAFEFAFKKATAEAESNLNPSAAVWLLRLAGSLVPMLIVCGIFVPIIIMTVKNYKKDKNSSYEEVPVDYEAASAGTPPVSGMGISGFSSSSDGSHHEAHYDFAKGGFKLSSVISIVVLVPFFLTGLGTMIGGFVMLKNGIDSQGGYFMIGFGAIWTALVVVMFCTIFKNLAKLRKKENEPENISYPTSEYPQPVMPGQDPVNGTPAQPVNNTEFDPQFFSSSSSNYEQDDEDYKRMKRQGFE